MSQLDDIKYKDWDSNKRIELTLFLKDYREKFISHMKSKDIPKSDEEIVKANALKDYIDKIKKLNGEYFEYLLKI